MIDFLKLVLPPSDTDKIIKNDKLNILSKVERSSGEFLDKDEAILNGIDIKIINKVARIHFSAHKLYNLLINKSFNNSGKFGFNQLQWVLAYIEKLFDIPLDHFRVENIEFGLNFFPKNINQTKMFDFPVIHRGRLFREMLNQKGEKIGRECRHQQYSVKMYHKGLQSGYDTEERRFELSVKKMAFLSEILTYSSPHQQSLCLTLADLRRTDVFAFFKRELLRVFDEILFYQKVENFKRLAPKDRDFILKITNPCHWGDVKPKGDEYTNALKKYNKLLSRRCIHNAKSQLRILLENKISELITKEPCKNEQNHTSFNRPIGKSSSGDSAEDQSNVPP